MPAARTFDALAYPERLNLGCGWDVRAGYLNVDLNDFHGPDLVADVTDLAMLPDGRYVEILAQDVLEHLPRTATLPTLVEWNRLLSLHARLVLRIPSLLDLARLFNDPGHQSPEQQEWLMQCLHGTQAYSGDVHLTSFTRPLLERYFELAGFALLEWKLRDEWLFEIELTKARDATASDEPDELDEYAELLRMVGNPVGFLADAYERALGRPPDPEGEAFFLPRLRSGVLTGRQVLETLLGSPEGARD